MPKFYTAITDDTETFARMLGKFCVMRDGHIVARCETEPWSCAITDALNMIDKIAEQATEMKTWPEG